MFYFACLLHKQIVCRLRDHIQATLRASKQFCSLSISTRKECSSRHFFPYAISLRISTRDISSSRHYFSIRTARPTMRFRSCIMPCRKQLVISISVEFYQQMTSRRQLSDINLQIQARKFRSRCLTYHHSASTPVFQKINPIRVLAVLLCLSFTQTNTLLVQRLYLGHAVCDKTILLTPNKRTRIPLLYQQHIHSSQNIWAVRLNLILPQAETSMF